MEQWCPQRKHRACRSLITQGRSARPPCGCLEDVDLSLGKSFTLGRTRLGLIGTVYNLLDSERPTAFCSSVTGCGSDFGLGDSISWQQPRRYEVGFRLQF